MTTYHPKTASKFFFISLFILSLFLLPDKAVLSQIEDGGQPAAVHYELPYSAKHITQVVLEDDMKARRDSLSGIHKPGEAPFAGLALPLDQDDLRGKWDVLHDSIHIWRTVIHSPEAEAIGVNFSVFEPGKDAKMFVYDPEKVIIRGAFSKKSHAEGAFSTAVIPGEYLIIEYQEPYYPGKEERIDFSQMEIESIIHISEPYLSGFEGSDKTIGNAGDCMVNINCSEGFGWQREKRGVARMLMRVGNNYSLCTGSLVNNTAEDGTPYFLSAEHCGRYASDEDLLFWQFYFNFEYENCGNHGYPPVNMVYGADLLSEGPLEYGSDFRLLKLHTTPPAHWRPYWNGWDRSDQGSFEGVGIHHPRGDVKKISTYFTNLESASPNVSGQQMATNSTWMVSWADTSNGHGVTEGGSSGSPLFNYNKKIIGTLTGGSSNCNNLDGFDFYGKIWYHWDQNGVTYAEQLQSYLDPLDTGAESLGGYDPYEDLQPSPGFVNASLDADQNALVNWYAPGTAPNTEGWYSHVNNYTHLTWAGPERVTVFDAHAMGLSYPLHLKKISHIFVEADDHPWSDDQFTFVIYRSNGLAKQYESETLTAEHFQEYIYELEEPLVFDDYFYVGVNPRHSSNHPSTLMKRVNLGQGYSLSGSAGNWNPHNDGQQGSYAYLTAIYVSEDKNAEPHKISADKNADHENISPQLHHDNNINIVREESAMMLTHGIIPDAYLIYRDNELIHTAGPADDTQLTNILEEEGLYRFHATAMYDHTESAPSNTAYLLKPGACDGLIDQWPYHEPFEEGFDDTCWVSEGLTGDGWLLRNDYNTPSGNLTPQTGDLFYLAEAAEAGLHDEWLITPVMDFSGIEHPALRFAFNGFGEDEDKPAYLTMRLSDDGKSFEKMWDSRYYPDFDPSEHHAGWLPATINLKRFAGKAEVRLAFQFAGGPESFFAIDHIEIMDGSTITYNLSVNVDPVNTGTVAGERSYLAGEKLLLRASPNVSHTFGSWLHEGNVIGHQEELLFIMPENNTQLTARFADMSTKVEEIPGEEKDIRVFPNPVKDQLNIVFNEPAQKAEISLVNIQGQVLTRQQLSAVYTGMEIQLHVGHMPRGAYFLRLLADDKQTVYRIVLTE